MGLAKNASMVTFAPKNLKLRSKVFKAKANCFSMKIAAPSKAIELMEWKSQCKKYFKDCLFDRDDLNVAQVFSPGIVTQAHELKKN